MPDAISPQLTLPGAASWMFCIHAAAVMLACLLIWRLLLWERRLVPAAVGWMLLVLRVTALGLVLIALLKPTWAWVIDRELSGRIVVAMDVSQSMQTSDLHATAAERLRWLAAVGWLSGDTPLPPPPAEPMPDQSVLPPAPEGIDDATWRELTTRLASLSRAEVARRTIFDGSEALWTQLQRLVTPQLQIFAGTSISAAKEDAADLVTTPPPALLVDTTRLASPLLTASVGDADSPLLGIVMFTDGRDADASSTLALARSLGQGGVPIFPVIVGSTERPKDLSILSIDTPLAVYRGDQPRVKVMVSTSGFSGKSLEVTLEAVTPGEDNRPQTRTITAVDSAQLVEFDLPAEELGDRRYRVSLPEWTGETRTDNNRRELSLQVVDDRTRVLLVDGEPRWEFRYLEIALARDERVDSQVILFEQPFLGLLADPFFPRTWPTDNGDGKGELLTDRDLAIIGDVSMEDLTEERWQSLDRFVSEQGGVLVLVAGRKSLPLGIDSAALRSLLPVTEPRAVTAGGGIAADPTSRGWTWSLTPEGEQQTCLQLAGDAESNRAVWNLLPGPGWAIAGTPKPGATVWAYGRQEGQADAVPLIVHQHYGLGQVVWLATDSTWRWRFRSSDQFHHRFWGQLARYAAASKLTAGNELVQFGPLQPRYNLGDPVELQARWSAKFLQTPPNQRAAAAEIYRAGEKVTEAPLVADPRRPLVSSVVLSALPAGDYTARLVATGIDLGPKPLESPFSITPPPTAELAELSANLPFLQELANSSGGMLLYPDQVSEISKHLRPFEALASAPQERPLWDGWPTLLILGGILTTEWVLRRRHGLP